MVTITELQSTDNGIESTDIINTNFTNLNTGILEEVYPIGSVYINATDPTNPATLLGFGTWVAWGVGKAIVGIDTSDTDFDTAEETGGAKTHTLTESELASHRHQMQFKGTSEGSTNSPGSPNTWYAPFTADTGYTGGNQPHNNLQPYQVGYVWKRTA